MNKVYQTTYGTEGNCFTACIASLLEQPLEKLPVLPLDASCCGVMNQWLHKQNLHYFEVEIKSVIQGTFENVDLLAIITSESKAVREIGAFHAVIARFDCTGALYIVHDPNKGSLDEKFVGKSVDGTWSPELHSLGFILSGVHHTCVWTDDNKQQ